MRLGGRNVGLVELDRRARECGLGVAALALQTLLRTVGRRNLCRIVFGFEIGFDVRLVVGITNAHCVGGGFGSLESVRHRERNVLTIITNNIVLKRRAPLDTDAFESLPRGGAEDLSNVRAMKNSSHAGNLFRGSRVEILDFAAGNCRLDRHGIQHSGKMEIGRVLRISTYLERAIYARCLATDR